MKSRSVCSNDKGEHRMVSVDSFPGPRQNSTKRCGTQRKQRYGSHWIAEGTPMASRLCMGIEHGIISVGEGAGRIDTAGKVKVQLDQYSMVVITAERRGHWSHAKTHGPAVHVPALERVSGWASDAKLHMLESSKEATSFVHHHHCSAAYISHVLRLERKMGAVFAAIKPSTSDPESRLGLHHDDSSHLPRHYKSRPPIPRRTASFCLHQV